MKNPHFAIRAFTMVLFTLMLSAVCNAQATRTWVSGVGDDVNPCSRTAPCKTFAGAIAKTAAGGEIDVLDPGGFGAVTITKSISIEASGLIAGILVTAGNGINVNTAATDTVVIRGLTFEGLGLGGTGINFSSAGTLHVENCTINNFAGNGIEVNPTGAAQVFVNDTIIRNNKATGGTNPIGGVYLHTQVGGSVTAAFDGVRIEKNAIGLRADDNTTVTIRNSIILNSTTKGVIANSTTTAAQITLESCLVALNTGNGITSSGTLATVNISNVTVTGNATGLKASGGKIISFGNNKVTGNTTADGVPTATILQI